MPLVVRSAVGAGGRFGAMHSQTHGTWFQGIPGLKLVAPVVAGRREGPAEGGDPRRQPGDLPRAQAPLLGQGPGAARSETLPIGEAAVVRRGRRPDDRLDREGRPRRARRPPTRSRATGSTSRSSTCARCGRSTLDTVLASVAKTNRLLAVEEGPRTGGWAGGLLGTSPSEACTTSTTPGSSPPARRRSPTARRSRTPSCPPPRRSSRRSGRGSEPGWRQPRE